MPPTKTAAATANTATATGAETWSVAPPAANSRDRGHHARDPRDDPREREYPVPRREPDAPVRGARSRRAEPARLEADRQLLDTLDGAGEHGDQGRHDGPEPGAAQAPRPLRHEHGPHLALEHRDELQRQRDHHREQVRDVEAAETGDEVRRVRGLQDDDRGHLHREDPEHERQAPRDALLVHRQWPKVRCGRAGGAAGRRRDRLEHHDRRGERRRARRGHATPSR